MKKQTFNYKIFAERITALLELSGDKDQAVMARKIGRGNDIVSKWKNGASKPPIDDLINIAEAYHCTLDYLVGLSNFAETQEQFSVREICSLLTKIGKETKSSYSVKDTSNEYSDENGSYCFEIDKKLQITMHYEESNMIPEALPYPEKNNLIIDYFAKVHELQKVSELLPEGFADDLISKWLADLDNQEYELKHKNDWLKEIDTAPAKKEESEKE